MKYLISALTIVFFLTIVVFSQAQEKQTVKKETKVEKVEKKDACCSTEKSEAKVEKKESCDTKDKASKDHSHDAEKDQVKSDDCCKTDKTNSSKSKESKN
ncbi:MAG: hypothetical protein WHV63_09910 [Ignavibacteria bacterium]|jgi:hypothetical protein|nr:hypothetical protein [Ignavibacteria bacterium]MDH7528546.1 hypothetical protein [Ignavibacteria bacterium]NPV11299.1 hypothetical protein [Ignavibacteria bacterium]